MQLNPCDAIAYGSVESACAYCGCGYFRFPNRQSREIQLLPRDLRARAPGASRHSKRPHRITAARLFARWLPRGNDARLFDGA